MFLRRLALFPHMIGLDAACVALLWQHLAGEVLSVPIGWAPRLVVFLSVLGVYLLDRAWDALRWKPHELVSLRHQLAGRMPLSMACFGVGCILVAVMVSLLWLPVSVIWAGIPIVGVCGIYYIFRMRSSHTGPSLFRAFAIGGIFTMGVSFVPLLQSDLWNQAVWFILVVLFLFSANAFECMKSEALSVGAGRPPFNPFLSLALAAGLVDLILTGHAEGFISALFLLGLSFAILRLTSDCYNALADAALLIPVVMFTIGLNRVL